MSIPTFETYGCGVVVTGYDGVRWTNQAGCLACRHPSAEGIFVPLKIRGDYLEHFGGDGLDDEGDCKPSGITENTARRIDELIADFCDLRVDRSRLIEGMEAWIPVRGTISGEPVTGYLVWDNCD